MEEERESRIERGRERERESLTVWLAVSAVSVSVVRVGDSDRRLRGHIKLYPCLAVVCHTYRPYTTGCCYYELCETYANANAK